MPYHLRVFLVVGIVRPSDLKYAYILHTEGPEKPLIFGDHFFGHGGGHGGDDYLVALCALLGLFAPFASGSPPGHLFEDHAVPLFVLVAAYDDEAALRFGILSGDGVYQLHSNLHLVTPPCTD